MLEQAPRTSREWAYSSLEAPWEGKRDAQWETERTWKVGRKLVEVCTMGEKTSGGRCGRGHSYFSHWQAQRVVVNG